MKLQSRDYSNRNLLAIPVGIKQKHNVNAMVQKVLFMNILIDYKKFTCISILLSNFIYFSFFQKILQLFYFIMTGMWMDGGVLTGVVRLYTLSLRIRQSGTY
jgi:hypothetical protein